MRLNRHLRTIPLALEFRERKSYILSPSFVSFVSSRNDEWSGDGDDDVSDTARAPRSLRPWANRKHRAEATCDLHVHHLEGVEIHVATPEPGRCVTIRVERDLPDGARHMESLVIDTRDPRALVESDVARTGAGSGSGDET